jgi:hypothetical protein
MNSVSQFLPLLPLWATAVLCICTPPVTVSHQAMPFSPTLFVTQPPLSCVGLPRGLRNITIRGNSVVELWCQSDKAFLVFPPRTSNDTNFSENDGLRSFFCAVRLDPATLLVDVGDLTFADPVPIPISPEMPVVFASAAECRTGTFFSFFNVDLRGTVFHLAANTMVTTFGWLPSNMSTISEAFKVLNASVHGSCGVAHVGPQTFAGYDNGTAPGGGGPEVFCLNQQWSLALALTLPNVPGAVLAPPCALPANLTGTLRCNATLRVSPPPLASSICPPLPAPTTSTTSTTSTTTSSTATTKTTTSIDTTTSSINVETTSDIVVANSSTSIATIVDTSGNDTVFIGAIVGGVVGALLILIVVAVLVWWFVIKARRREQPHKEPSPSLPSSPVNDLHVSQYCSSSGLEAVSAQSQYGVIYESLP